ncbi:ornithine carbamoyltransferase [Thermatribacter velox]|jgi:ornithine carbamoyltransferase|uniref:Ornithine carbamoyltransferase n=1 Tax=Thermatribacter velox TaxID=3039681 RepID=A0ABZ2YC17_9BACT|nr:ornithine carbamoyltransferase [Candidatus Atribacteria bacterium]
MQSFKGRDFIDIADFSKEEIEYILYTALELKRRLFLKQEISLLKEKVLALLFEKPSLRTRVSFELAMLQLGGKALYLGPQEVGLGKREAIKDVALVLSRMVDGIMIRTFAHSNVLELANYATVPVINGLSDLHHPCQIMGDLLTIKEKKGRLEDLKICFVGDGNNVCNSLVVASAVLGLETWVSTPPRYKPDAGVWEWAESLSKKSGAKIVYEADPSKAVENADVVYTDVWVSMGKEAEYETRIQHFKPYQVNSDLLSQAAEDAIVMHCMPAHRGEEITDEVMDGPQSVVYEQAENRLHAQKAILALILG